MINDIMHYYFYVRTTHGFCSWLATSALHHSGWYLELVLKISPQCYYIHRANCLESKASVSERNTKHWYERNLNRTVRWKIDCKGLRTYRELDHGSFSTLCPVKYYRLRVAGLSSWTCRENGYLNVAYTTCNTYKTGVCCLNGAISGYGNWSTLSRGRIQHRHWQSKIAWQRTYSIDAYIESFRVRPALNFLSDDMSMLGSMLDIER